MIDKGKKKPGFIIGLLAGKDKPSADKEPGAGLGDDGAMEEDEGTQLASSAMDAMKSDDPSAFYSALRGLFDHFMEKDQGAPTDLEKETP